MTEDFILNKMATELQEAILRAGLDPKDPPGDTKPPASLAFREYQNRGGILYTDADEMVKALVKKVTEL